MKVAARQTLRPAMRPITMNQSIRTSSQNTLVSNRRGKEKTSYSPKRNNKSNWNNNSESKITSIMQDPVLISLRNQCLEQDQDADIDFSEIDSSTLENFHRHIREYKQSCALDNNYKDAQTSLRISKLVFHEIQKRNFSNYYNSTIEKKSIKESNSKELKNQHNFEKPKNEENRQSSCEEIDQFNSNFSIENEDVKEEEEQNSEDEISNFNQKTEEKRAALLKRHEQQLQRFEDAWTNEMPSKYRKPSSLLLEIKEKERSLALIRNYDEAEKLHKIAGELIRKETEEAQARLISDYKTAKKQLLLKHSKEIETFEASRNDKLNILMTRNQEKKEAELRREMVIATQKIMSQKLFSDFFNQSDDDDFPEEGNDSKLPRPTTSSMLVMAMNSGRVRSTDSFTQRSAVNSPVSYNRRKCNNCATSRSPSSQYREISKSSSAPRNRSNLSTRPKLNSQKSTPKKLTPVIRFKISSDSESESESIQEKDDHKAESEKDKEKEAPEKQIESKNEIESSHDENNEETNINDKNASNENKKEELKDNNIKESQQTPKQPTNNQNQQPLLKSEPTNSPEIKNEVKQSQPAKAQEKKEDGEKDKKKKKKGAGAGKCLLI